MISARRILSSSRLVGGTQAVAYAVSCAAKRCVLASLLGSDNAHTCRSAYLNASCLDRRKERRHHKMGEMGRR